MLIKNESVKDEYANTYSLTNKNIVLPIFQRGYAWDAKKTSKILEDIENNSLIYNHSPQDLKTIYLLDFIWYEENNFFKLADGQQRLVSLSIFIKAFNDVATKLGLSYSISQYNIRYEDIDMNLKFTKFMSNDLCTPFKKVYLHFYDWITARTHLMSAMKYVIENTIYVYLKKAATPDDAFAIFEQINTGGKPLTKDEIIKTVLTQYSSKYGITIDPKIKKNEIRKMINGYYKYLHDASAGSSFDNFAIMSFLSSDIISTQATFKNFADYIKIAQSINDDAVSSVISYIQRSDILDIIYVLKMKQIDIYQNRDYLEKLILPLCLQSIIMTAKKANPGGIIKSYYQNIIKLIKADKSINEITTYLLKFIDDNKVISTISAKDFEDAIGSVALSTNIKKGLMVLDVVMRNTSGRLDIKKINLEHIYPQKPKQSWALNGWPVNNEEQNELINNIGNYLLLNEEVNKKIKNDFLDVKVPQYNVIIPRDIMLQTPINTVDFTQFETRRKAYILERQHKIVTDIYNNYPFAKVLIV